uniref:Uncharacterized protein n=1 Tax=Leersia perrieri TaxID=77586 RepID=A0A0D9XT10_9ORYZ
MAAMESVSGDGGPFGILFLAMAALDSEARIDLGTEPVGSHSMNRSSNVHGRRFPHPDLGNAAMAGRRRLRHFSTTKAHR